MKTKKPLVSVVIPTLNEEKFLPKLLQTLSNQTFKDFEVIVADAGSKDKTAQLAKEWGAKIVKGGKPGPGRNAGAKVAKGRHIFFFDADVEIPEDFIELALKEIKERKLDCATWGVYASDGDISYKLLYQVVSKVQSVITNIGIATAGGYATYCTKPLFNKIKGFDESLYLSEDIDFVERASKVGSFGFLHNVWAGISVRRWKKEGGLKMGAKYLYVLIYMSLFGTGSVRTEIIDYEFGKYGEVDEKKFMQRMREFLQDLSDIEKLKNGFANGQEKSSQAVKKLQESIKKIFPRDWVK